MARKKKKDYSFLVWFVSFILVITLFSIIYWSTYLDKQMYKKEIQDICAVMGYPVMTNRNGFLYCSKSEQERGYTVLDGVAIMADAMYGAQKATQFDIRGYSLDKTDCASVGVKVQYSVPNKTIIVICN